MSFLYFAYGSNMLSSRLIARCSTARVVKSADTQGYILEFSKRSVDGFGKATLIRDQTTAHTPGVLFELETHERNALDKAEGAGAGYDRVDDFGVATTDGTITATTYLAAAIDPALIPFDWYLALVIAGAVEHDLPCDHVDRLRAIEHRSDLDTTRKSRITALEALTAVVSHGVV